MLTISSKNHNNKKYRAMDKIDRFISRLNYIYCLLKNRLKKV